MREATVTPEYMAALAESASSALELLEWNAPLNRLVSDGLRDAETFCTHLESGLIRRETPARLSPSSLATGELLELVFQIEDEANLKKALPRVRAELEKLKESKPRRQELSRLRDFFFQFAMKLDEVSGLHRKIAAEI